MDVDAYIAERVPLIDAAIDARLPAAAATPDDRSRGDAQGSLDGPIPATLVTAMRHLLFPGGKRLRPVFALAAAEAVGGPADAALPIAVAVEMIHTYSLIHDDLPCMDDDDLRRGRPTVHVAHGEATAVLAGDALLTEAFAVLADGASTSRDAGAILIATATLARAAGAQGLVGGQVDDLAFESRTPDEGTDAAWLASIHARKTAALFRAALVGGAALAGATPAERACLDGFGREIGIAFQIADDVLDADSDEAASILRLQGVEDARRGAEGLLDRALQAVEGWGERAEPLRELARFAVRRNR